MCDTENLDRKIYIVGKIEWRDDEKGAERARPSVVLSTRIDVEVKTDGVWCRSWKT